MNMKKLIIISVLVHVVLLAVFAPLIRTRMEFDEKEEAERTAEVKKREMDRKEQDRLRREKQKLDEKTARMLKREAELRKKEEITRQVKELRKKREEMMERRKEELERFRERQATDVIAREKAAIDLLARKAKEHISSANDVAMRNDTVLGRYPNENKGMTLGFLDDLKVSNRIWSEGEIAGESSAQVASDYLWDFENGPKESIGGGELVLDWNSKIVTREDGAGMALDLTEKFALVRLGPVEYGEAFTIATSVRLESTDDGEQVILTNGHSGNYNRSLRFIVSGKDGEGRVIFRTTGSNSSSADTSTKPGSFTFGKWVRLVITVDIATEKVRIFIDGTEAELVENELAEETTTGATDLRDLKTMTDEAMDGFMKEELDLTDIAEAVDNLDEVLERIAEEMEKEQDNHAARNEMSRADQAIDEMKEALAGLEPKTDMAEMNNTDAAQADQMEPPAPANDATANAAEMYAEAEGLEKQIAEAKADIDAAGEAVSENTSYSEARQKAMSATPSRPDLSSALGGKPPGTVGELNEFRENLNRAENEMQDMNARADSALGRSQQQSLSASSFATGAAMSSAAMQSGQFGAVVDMTSFGSASGDGDSQEMRMDESGDGAEMKFSDMPKTLSLSEGKIIQNAMPGRRFTESSLRKGWLYLDTWYVVGPWENKSIVDYSVKHPPEFGIDFDAKYYDGKFADRPGHPYETLKWEFYQSDQVRCQPPAVYGASTYYAYTDVWFENARDMLIAVASDDASSVWLNGQIVWQDTGQSAWSLGEGYRKVHFKQGFNDILVRIENGPTHCVWSVVLCPPEMLNK